MQTPFVLDTYLSRPCYKDQWGFDITEDNIFESSESATAIVTRSYVTGDIFVVFKGSKELRDWTANLKAAWTPCTLGAAGEDCGDVHFGLMEQYASLQVQHCT